MIRIIGAQNYLPVRFGFGESLGFHGDFTRQQAQQVVPETDMYRLFSVGEAGECVGIRRRRDVFDVVEDLSQILKAYAAHDGGLRRDKVQAAERSRSRKPRRDAMAWAHETQFHLAL